MTLHLDNEKILLHDGSTKKAYEISLQDHLMGPDSKPRKVLSIEKIIPKYTITTCNGQTMKLSENCSIYMKPTNQRQNEKNKSAKIVKINDYLKKSNWYKHIHKLSSVPIYFSEKELKIDPYFVGVLLGDGSFIGSINVTTEDKEIVDYLHLQSIKYGTKLRVDEGSAGNAKTYFFTVENCKKGQNMLRNEIINLHLLGRNSGNKFIPHNYLFNSTQNRLQLLAGLMDTDGSKSANNCYDYISKSKQLAEDVCFLSRSLGYRAKTQKITKKCQTDFVGQYYRVSISCNENLLPVRIARKISGPRMQKKNVQMFGFDIIELQNETQCFGFILDKDNTYLDDNFIVLVGC